MFEETPVAASFLFTLDEAKTAQTLSSPGPRLRTVISILVFVVGLGPILIGILLHRIAFNASDWSLSKIVVFVVGIAALFLLFKYQHERNLKQAFSQSPGSNKRIDLQFSRDGIISKIEGRSEVKSQWSSFVRVRRTKKGLLFFFSPQAFFWVPEHAFSSTDDADAVAGLARKFARKFVDR